MSAPPDPARLRSSANIAVPLTLAAVIVLPFGLAILLMFVGQWFPGDVLFGVAYFLLTLTSAAWPAAVATALAAPAMVARGARRRRSFLLRGALAGALGMGLFVGLMTGFVEAAGIIASAPLGAVYGSLTALAFRAILARLSSETFAAAIQPADGRADGGGVA